MSNVEQDVEPVVVGFIFITQDTVTAEAVKASAATFRFTRIFPSDPRKSTTLPESVAATMMLPVWWLMTV